MNIAVDVRPTERPASRNRGIGLYTKQVVGAILERNRAVGKPHSFTLITSRPAEFRSNELSLRQVPAIRKPSRLQWLLDRWTLPRVLRSGAFDVFHAMEFSSIPISKGTKVIAHVHDMIPFLFWKEYSPRIPWDFRLALQAARKRMAKAACVVTVSEHSKRDIVELTGYPEERIYVAYLGAPDAGVLRPSPAASQRPLPEGKAPYFLYVGGTDFRKNVPFLLRAFARIAASERDVQLMLVGETFSMTGLAEIKELLDAIHRLKISDRVVMMGYVDDQRLREMYKRSIGLVFPSLYEGFGLPVLEAMSYGTPVLAARTSSVPEVLGDTGLYFDPRDEDSLVAGMETTYRNPRPDLVERARQRAQLFSWEKVAEVMFRIYEAMPTERS